MSICHINCTWILRLLRNNNETGMRFPKALYALAISSVVLFGCGDTGPIKIGFIAGLSGGDADTGNASLNALKLAASEVNKTGGIKGRTIEIIARDDQKDPKTALAAIREFDQLGVTAVIGPIISSIGMAMLPVINELGIVTVSPTVSAAEFAGLHDYLFRINSTTRDNATAYARHNIEKGRKRIALALDGENEAFTESWYREFLLDFDKRNGRVVSKVWINTPETSIALAARHLLAEEPDAIVLITNAADSAKLAREIRKIDRNIALSAAEWAGSEQLIELGGDAVEGMELVQAYDRYSNDTKYKKFIDDYQQMFGTQPGYTSVLTYDAATILFAALDHQDPKQSLADAMITLPPQQGLQQDLIFDQFGDGNRNAYFVRIRDGKFIVE